MMEKINRLNIAEHLLEYQFSLIGKTMEDAKNDEFWWGKWSIPIEKQEEFVKYAVPLIKKVLKCNGRKAKYTIGWFIEDMGLKVK